VAAFLRQIGGGEVDDQPIGRQGQAKPGEGGAHPLAALAHRLVAEADDDEGHLAGGGLHLHIDAPRLDALERHRHNRSGHICPHSILKA
jgi:hypothetical protein